MVANSSAGETGRSTGSDAIRSAAPITRPPAVPPPALKADQAPSQWSRPPRPLWSTSLVIPDVGPGRGPSSGPVSPDSLRSHLTRPGGLTIASLEGVSDGGNSAGWWE